MFTAIYQFLQAISYLAKLRDENDQIDACRVEQSSDFLRCHVNSLVS